MSTIYPTGCGKTKETIANGKPERECKAWWHEYDIDGGKPENLVRFGYDESEEELQGYELVRIITIHNLTFSFYEIPDKKFHWRLSAGINNKSETNRITFMALALVGSYYCDFNDPSSLDKFLYGILKNGPMDADHAMNANKWLDEKILREKDDERRKNAVARP